MKQSALFTGQKFGNFFQFFKKKAPKVITPISVEELKDRITSLEYEARLQSLVKEDLLNQYQKSIVEEVLEDLSFLVFEVNSAEEFPEKQEKEQEIKINLELDLDKPRSNYIVDGEKKNEIDKIENRIPKWLRNPHQINSKIFITYMELLGDGKSVPLHKLETSCRSIKTFQSNYNQMKIIGERNHAKVFEECGGLIILWEPVRMFVKKEYEKYNRRRGKSNTA